MSKALNPPCGEVRSVPALALGQSRGLTASLLCFPPMVGLPPTILLSSHFLGSGRSVVWPCLTCLSLLPCEVGVWPAPCHRKSLGDPSSPGSGGGWGGVPAGRAAMCPSDLVLSPSPSPRDDTERCDVADQSLEVALLECSAGQFCGCCPSLALSSGRAEPKLARAWLFSGCPLVARVGLAGRHWIS